MTQSLACEPLPPQIPAQQPQLRRGLNMSATSREANAATSLKYHILGPRRVLAHSRPGRRGERCAQPPALPTLDEQRPWKPQIWIEFPITNMAGRDKFGNDDWNMIPNNGPGCEEYNDGFDANEHITAGGDDNVCRNCQAEGHFARECPEPRKDIVCYNCGGSHMKKDCDKPLAQRKLCKLCKVEDDHETAECTAKYPVDFNNVPDIVESECWRMLQDAADADDVFDFHLALKALQKAVPESNYGAVEKQLRKRGSKFYLIALEKDVGGGMTNVDYECNAGKKYVLSVQKKPHCNRPNMAAAWPKDAGENTIRLADAGITMESGLTYCRNCEQYGGHTAKHCPEPKVEADRAKVTCALCGEEGHRVRDCTEERKKPREPRTCKICDSEDHIAKDCDQKPAFECRNCGQEGHKASECTEPRNITCRNCDQQGHMAVECTEPRKLLCHNCAKEGHVSRECDQPRDWTKVTCRHCGEVGHASTTRCKPGAAERHAAQQPGREDTNLAFGHSGNSFQRNDHESRAGAGQSQHAKGDSWDHPNVGGGGSSWDPSNTKTTTVASWDTPVPAAPTNDGGW